MNKEYLLDKIRTAPVGFGVDETQNWLSSIPEIKSFIELEDFFDDESFSAQEFRALTGIMYRRYLEGDDKGNLFDGNYENYIMHNTISDSFDGLFFFGDSSQILDFRSLDKKMFKIKVCGARKVSKIILPLNVKFEALNISYTLKLTHIENIERMVDLKVLSFDKCKLFLDFKFIERLNKLRFLGISGTSELPELDFLNEKSNISVLHLVDTNAMKLKNTIENLSKLKKLKFLRIKANQKELREIREQLPKCLVNGFTLEESLKEN